MGEATHRDDPVAVGTPLGSRTFNAHHGDVADDDVGLDLAQVVVADAPAVETVGGVVRGDEVGLFGEFADGLDAFLGFEVERDRLLAAGAVVERAVGVDREVVRRLHAPVANRVDAGLRFDLEDLGAEVGEQPGAERTGNGPGEIEDSDAVEGASGWWR